jgi:hypothetical protein
VAVLAHSENDEVQAGQGKFGFGHFSERSFGLLCRLLGWQFAPDAMYPVVLDSSGLKQRGSRRQEIALVRIRWHTPFVRPKEVRPAVLPDVS